MPMLFPTSPTVGQVFTSGGRSWVWTGATWDSPTATNTLLAPYGLELVKAQTIGTAVTSVTVSDAFSAKYDVYKITVSGGVASSDDRVLSLKLGTASTGHNSILTYVSYAGAGPTIIVSSNTGIFNYAGAARTNSLFMNLDLINPFLLQPTLALSTYSDSTNGGSSIFRQTAATSFTSFDIAINAGTITGGTIAVYGYRKDA
jgi:hypothetical protein